MLSDKLLQLLRSFSKVDLNRFEKYLSSPYFNENQEILLLFDWINRYLRNEAPEKKSLRKQEVWKNIFPQKAYHDTTMRRLCSDLTQLALGFLALKHFKNHSLQEEINMLEAVNQPKLKKHFNGILRKVENQQDSNRSRDVDFHYHSFQVQWTCHKNLEFLGKKRTDFENFAKADYHLDSFYTLQKLKNYCDYLGYKNIMPIEEEISLFPSFLEYIKNSDFMKEAAVRGFYLVSEMLLDPEEEEIYFELKKLLQDRQHEFGAEDIKLLYTHLRNYCIDTKINTGRSDYFRELFELYSTQVRSGLILEDDLISPQNYKNIITVALHIKEFEWAENFIQQYTDLLPAEDQDNDRNYNLAKVYFHKEDYGKVIEQLRAVEYRKVIYSLGGKLMLLKTYYELQEYLALDSLVESFRIYLRRSTKIPKEVKQQYLNVLRFTKKLAGLPPGDRQAVTKIKGQVLDCKALASKKWLLEKIEALE